MRERKCNSRCWWAKNPKCTCKCEGKQHGILRDENKDKLKKWVKKQKAYWRRKRLIKENENPEEKPIERGVNYIIM